MENRTQDASFADAEAQLEKAGRVEELIRLYETRAREVPISAEVGRLLHKAGELARDRLKRFDRAEDFFRRAALADPSERAPLIGLKSLFEQKQDAQGLAETLERLGAHSKGVEAAALFLRAADLYEQKLGRRDRAILCLQQATRADPQAREAYDRIRRILMADFKLQSAFECLERQRAALGGGKSLAEPYTEIAEAALDMPEAHPLGLRAAHIALELDPAFDRAQAAIRAIESSKENWKTRVRVLRQDSLEERDRRKAAYLSLAVARLHAAWDPKGRARMKDALDRCFLLWPAMPDALDLMVRTAEADGALPAAEQAIEKMATAYKEKTAQVDLWLYLGQLRLTRLDDKVRALEAFEKATRIDLSRTDAVSLCAEQLLEQGRTHEAIALYERHLPALKDRQQQISLRLRIARLCTTVLRNPSAARTHLEAALALEPHSANAAFELCRILAEAADAEAIAPLLELALLAPRPVSERVSLCEGVALLCEERGEAKKAFEALARALVLDPANPSLLQGAAEHAQKANAAGELALWLRRAATNAPGDAATALWRNVGRLLSTPEADPALWREAWEEVLRLSPGDGEATAALRALQQAAQAAAPGPADEKARLEAEARALEAKGADPEAAIVLYRRILELAPDDVTALKRLGAACAALGRWEDVAYVAARMAELSLTPAEQQEWRARLAQVYSERLGRRDEAAGLYLALLAEGVRTEPILNALEKLARAHVREAEIARALAPIYETAGDHQRRAASLLVQLSTTKDRSEQKSLIRALAGLHEQALMDGRAALSFWLRGIALDPSDGSMRTEAVRLARDLHAQAEVARQWIDLAGRLSDAEAASALFLEAAELAEEARSPEDAIHALQAALMSRPGDPEIFTRLLSLLQGSRRLQEAEGLVRRRLEALAGDQTPAAMSERLRLLLSLCDVRAELGRPADAADALKEALAAGADEAEHLPRLCDLYAQAGRNTELAWALARHIQLAQTLGDADLVARLSLRRAQVLEAALGDRSAAVKNYSDILRQKPSDPDALAALEALLEDPDCAAEAAHALAPAYEAVNDHRKLVHALDRIAAGAKATDEKVAALRKAAEVHLVHLRQPEMAFAALMRAVQVFPLDGGLRSAARQAAEDADLLPEFAEQLEELTARAEGAVAAALHRELADLYEKKLDDRDRAIAHLRAVLAQEPAHLDALKALQRLHRGAEAWAALAEVLEQMAAVAPTPAERIAALREAATLHEQKLTDTESAAAAWRRIAEADALDREAALALDRLYTQAEDPRGLAFALELRRAQEGQSPQGREVAFRLAGLKRAVLGDPRAALSLYRQILDEDPGHAGTREVLEQWARSDVELSAAAMEVLDPVLARAGDHARRIALREARLGFALTEEKARLAEEIRRIAEVDLGQPEAAFMVALKAFSWNIDRERVQADLERLAKITGSWDDLADIYEAAADELLPGDPQLAGLLRRAAELREQLGETEEATRLWKQVQEELPQDRAALEALTRLYEQTSNARNLSEVYARQAQLAQEPPDKRELLQKAALAYESAGDDANAIESFKAALAIEVTRAALEGLDRLYGRTRQHTAQADVLDQLVQLAPGAEEKRQYRLRRAQLLEKGGQYAEALDEYLRVLEVAPSDPGAVQGLERLMQVEAVRAQVASHLEPVYRSLNDRRKLAEVLDLRLATARAEDRPALIAEIATLREALGEKSLAFAARLRAFTEAPEDEGARAELERLAADTGAFEELAGAYEDAIERGAPEPLAVELWRKLAAVYLERLERPDLAARALEEVARRVPDDLVVLDTLARIYRKSKQFRELAHVMRRQVGAHPSLEEQVNILFELGNLAEEQLHDKAIAAKCYQAILDRKPSDLNAFKLLGRVLQETERYPELAQLIEKEIALAESRGAVEEALELTVRLGRLKHSRLGDPRSGLELFQKVLSRKPQHAGAIGALEELAKSDSALRGEAASALEPVFAGGGDHLKLVQMLESRVSSETVPKARAELLRRMADIYAQHLDSPEQAFITATRALRELPDDPESLALCIHWAKPADAEDALVETLEEVAPRATTPTARAALYRALAQAKVREGDPEAALEAWRKVVEATPEDAQALEEMGRLLAAQNRAPELLEVLRRQLSTAESPERRAALLFQIGTLQADTLMDTAGALATFRRLIELNPEDARALERMDALCAANERWTELADVLTRRIALLGGDTSAAALELKFRLGQVREARLMDRLGALDAYTELLAVDPRHPGALGRVEAMVEREPQNVAASDVLLRAYRASGEAQKLAQLLESRAGLSQDSWERKGFLLELAQLRLEVQDEPELAFMSLLRAFREDPNDADVRARLERAADAAKTWDELAGVYEEDLPRIAEAKDAAELCLKLGHLNDQRLGDAARAVEFFEKARTLDPALWEARALVPLERLYNQLNRADRLAEVLELLAKNAEAPQDRIGYLFRLGQLAQEILDSPDRAAQAYEAILELDPNHLASARLLEQLYEESHHSDRLYRILEHMRDRVQGPEKERVLQKMAALSADAIGDVAGSIAIYRDLLQKNPRNEQAFAALEALLEKAQQYDALRELLENKLKATIDPRELVRLNDRLGRVVWKLAGKPEEAVPYFKAALERDARHRGALEALREIYEAGDQKDDLVVVLRRLVPLAEDAQAVKRVRIRLAEVLAALQRREEALDAARRALEVEPHAPAELDAVYQVFVSLRAFGDAARALELRADALLLQEQKDAAVQTLFELADLWRGSGGRPESAGPALERILELDPANRTAYEQARELYQRGNDWRAWAQVTDRYLPNLVTEEEKLATLRELISVQEHKLGQKDVAFLSACRALQLNPADDAIRQEVERLADETGSHEELAAVYEEVADELPRGPLAERLYLTLAKVHDLKLDDAAAAEAALRKILEFDPTNQVALDTLAAMFSRRGRNKEYVVALEQQLETAGSIEQRKSILREIARVFDDRLGDPGEAAHALLRALELEADVDTLSTLVALYRRQKQWPEVAQTLIRWRDLAPDPVERARLQTEVAQVYEREIADDEAAIEGYRQALEFDPTNREALTSLERLYTRLDRPAELLSVYERQLEVTQDYRERVKILFKSAQIWEDKYQNLQNADACIEGVLSMDPQNLQAIKTLERLRRSQERWEELVGVIEHHIQLSTSREEQAELCVEMGDVFHQHLRQVDRAVATFHRALELNPKSRQAMHALGTLYERSGNWPFALDMLGREAELAGATPEAVELYHRMGKINEDMLLDPASAKACYEAALRIDPGYLPCIRALKGIHEIEKDWEGYERALIQEAQQTEDPEARAKALVEVARYFLDKKEDRDGASKYFEEALKHVPDLLDAARPLADIYVAREDWAGAEKMLDIVAVQMANRAVSEQDEALARELCRQLYRLGYVSEKLGRKDKALGAYEKAYQLDATYLPALEGLGNLLVQAKRYEEALKVYQTILIHHRDDLTDLEVVEIYWQLGDVHFALGQLDRAQNHFEKALDIDPHHDPSLRAMIRIADETSDWEKAAEHRRRLLEVLDGDAKFQMAVELGILAREKLNDPYRAIDAYLVAHRLRPNGLEVMDALYVLYRETKQGQKAGEILEKMLAEPELRKSTRFKRVWFALGEVARDELKDLDRAVMAFNAALDSDYRFVDAFSALEQLLAAQKQWKLLEENYARMIQRIPRTPETHAARMTLWRSLGDLYLKVLKHNEGALMAYQVVAAGMPDDAAVQETYAQLAGEKPGEEAKAVEAWRRALPTTTDPAKVVSALATLQARRKEYDLAYLAAQVAQGLIGQVGDAEREILTKLAPYAKRREQATHALTDRLWRTHLFHPKVRGPLAEIMSLLYDQVGHLFAAQHSQFQISPKKHRIDVATAQVLQIHQYRYVARLLGMEAVELYSPYLVATLERMAKRSNEPAPEPLVGIEICHTHPVCIKVGGKFFPRDANEASQKELQYQLGRTFALIRPELALCQRLPAEKLEALLQAAVSLFVNRFRYTADPRAIDEMRRLLDKHMTDQARIALSREIKAWVANASADDLRHYLEGAELTATRTGLFVAGEVEPVKRMVLGETGNAYRVPPRSKIRDLMVFALSDDLHTLRAAVGTSIEIPARR
ncbi:MAG: tetratricopeptide repeat protein [Myxococcaceae bacterium]|nr:tetratricopeptide repeat protein [Myxococcaceae bacterium]